MYVFFADHVRWGQFVHLFSPSPFFFSPSLSPSHLLKKIKKKEQQQIDKFTSNQGLVNVCLDFSLPLLRGVLCCANQTPKMAHANINTQTPNYKNTQTNEGGKAKEQSNSSALRSFFPFSFVCFAYSLFPVSAQFFRERGTNGEAAAAGSTNTRAENRTEQRRRNPRVRFCPTCVSVCLCLCLSAYSSAPAQKRTRGEKCLLF